MPARQRVDARLQLHRDARRHEQADTDRRRPERRVGKLLQPQPRRPRQQLRQHEEPQEQLHQERHVAEEFDVSETDPRRRPRRQRAQHADHRAEDQRNDPRQERRPDRQRQSRQQHVEIGAGPARVRLKKDMPVPVVVHRSPSVPSPKRPCNGREQYESCTSRGQNRSATYCYNTVTVYSEKVDNPENRSANVTIKQNPSYAIEKTIIGVTDSNGSKENITAAGDVIAYQVNVTNDGNIDLNNVTVTDPLVNNLTGNNDTVLNVTETWTYTGNYTVTQEDLNNNGEGTGFINNTATVDCDQLDPQNDSANVTIKQNPAYAIDKTITDVSGNGSKENVTAAGDVIAYQVNVTNDGNIDLTNVTVTDPLVNNLTGNNDTVLNVAETWTFTGNYTVTQEDINSNGEDGFINNTATVDCDQLDSQNDSANVTIEQNPLYAIEKTIIDVTGNGSKENVTKAGDVIAYQVNVTNDGNIDLTNVTVTDPLVNNLTGNNDTVLNVTETWTYTGNYTVTQEDINSNGSGDGFINNTATVDCDQLDSQNDSANVTIIQNPSYAIEKTVTGVNGQSGGNVTAAGDVIAYQVNVTNDGNIDLNNVNVTDSLISLTGPVESNSNDTVLNVGESWTYTGNYTVTQEEINTNGTAGDGFINNNATVDCDLLDSQNDTVQVPIERNPSNAIDKSVIDVAGKGPEGNATEAGDVIAYQVKVTNDGNIDLTNVNVTDSLTNLAGPVESNSNDTILEVGENWTYTGNYTVTQEDINSNGTGTGFINNIATVYSDQVGPKSASASVDPKSDSADVPIEQNPHYSIFKSVIGPDEDGDCIVNSAGDEVPYRIVVKNDGNVDLTGVSVSDPMIC